MMAKKTHVLILFLLVHYMSNAQLRIDLSGQWGFQLCSKEKIASWNETVLLPGSLDENKKGIPNIDSREVGHLNRDYKYIGAASFRKDIAIPSNWDGKMIQLRLGRTKKTHVWIDNTQVGDQQKSYITTQTYDITPYVKAGKQQSLIVEVDNSPEGMPSSMYSTFAKNVPWNHQLTEETQTNWNGIIGDLALYALDPVHIGHVKVRPDVANKTANISITIKNTTGKSASGTIVLAAESFNHTGEAQKITPQTISFAMQAQEVEKTISVPYLMGDNMLLWDEFTPNLYHLKTVLSGQADSDNISSEYNTDFGMRSFKIVNTNGIKGKQFQINGKTILLRGEINNATFPITAYTPMDIESWKNLFSKYKEYGINHVRFHSNTPPPAACQAADLLGLYLHYELPQWSYDKFNDDFSKNYFKEEVKRVFAEVGNSPSLVMLGLGNELSVGNSYFDTFIAYCRALEPDILYTDIAGHSDYSAEDDFGVTIPKFGGEYMRKMVPSTNWDYSEAVNNTPKPFIAHEPGQLQSYPDYATELPKYAAKNCVLKPRNLEYFRNNLTTLGMENMAGAFSRSSGKLSAMLYRYTTESYFRTPQSAGFDLLGLQDFPGQGTALVGIVDVFMESKGHITAEEFRRSCNSVVLLAELPKYVWRNDENFSTHIKIANFGAKAMNTPIQWNIKTKSGETIASGTIPGTSYDQGKLSDVGNISCPLTVITQAQELELTIESESNTIRNNYPLWVYPHTIATNIPDDIILVRAFTREAEQALAAGKKVLLISNGEKESLPLSKNVEFVPDFWSPMFHKEGYDGYTLGCYVNKDHPLFNHFPTDDFASWQWYNIVHNHRGVILNNAPHEWQPIVQPIATIDQVYKLGSVLEAKMGNGKLFVSSINLIDKEDIAAKQLLHSIINYMQSEEFVPATEIPSDILKTLFPGNDIKRLQCFVPKKQEIAAIQVSSEMNESWAPYQGSKMIDADEQTFWNSNWNTATYPHTITLELKDETLVSRLEMLPRQGTERTITQYKISGSKNGHDYFLLTSGEWSGGFDKKEAVFSPQTVKYVQLEALKGTHDKEAAIAEISLLCQDDEFLEPEETCDLNIHCLDYLQNLHPIPEEGVMTYSSDNERVVSVSKNGVVTALSKGVAHVAITLECNGQKFGTQITFVVGQTNPDSGKIQATDFEVSATSTEPDGNIAFAFDNNDNTFWQSNWKEPQGEGKLPQSIHIRFTTPRAVDKIVYLPRQGHLGGNISQAEIYVDNRLITSKTGLKNDFSAKLFSFEPTPVNTLEFKMIDALWNAASVAELSLYNGVKLVTQLPQPAPLVVRYDTPVENLPLQNKCVATLDDGTQTEVYLKWDLGSYNRLTPATYSIVGTPILFDAVNALGLTIKLEITVKEKDTSLGDKTALDALMKYAFGLSADSYSSQSWEQLQKSLQEATGVMIDTDAYQHDVDVAYDHLKNALDSLETTASVKSVKNESGIAIIPDSFGVNVLSPYPVKNIDIFDQNGTLCLSTTQKRISTDSLGNGAYLFRIKTSECTVTRKWIKTMRRF